MVGSKRGFVSFVEIRIPTIARTHCILIRGSVSCIDSTKWTKRSAEWSYRNSEFH